MCAFYATHSVQCLTIKASFSNDFLNKGHCNNRPVLIDILAAIKAEG